MNESSGTWDSVDYYASIVCFQQIENEEGDVQYDVFCALSSTSHERISRTVPYPECQVHINHEHSVNIPLWASKTDITFDTTEAKAHKKRSKSHQ